MEQNLTLIYGGGMALLVISTLYLFFRCKHASERSKP
jgi:hypothetical protein